MTSGRESPFISFVDLLTGVIFILLLMTVVLVLLPHEQKDKDKEKSEDFKIPECTIVMDVASAMRKAGHAVQPDMRNCVVQFPTDEMFRTSSAVLSPALKAGIIASFAQTLRGVLGCYLPEPELDLLTCSSTSYVIVAVLITGHTDRRGTFDYNLRLSAARAAAFYQAVLDAEPLLYYATSWVTEGDSLFGIAGYAHLRPAVRPPVNDDEPKDRRIAIQFIITARQ